MRRFLRDFGLACAGVVAVGVLDRRLLFSTTLWEAVFFDWLSRPYRKRGEP